MVNTEPGGGPGRIRTRNGSMTKVIENEPQFYQEKREAAINGFPSK